MAKETLYGRIYHDLLASIQNGRYKKGALLPSEKELAQRYGVSRITSQKALSMLAESGYTVSYTHLDVYKRQSLPPSDSIVLLKTYARQMQRRTDKSISN